MADLDLAGEADCPGGGDGEPLTRAGDQRTNVAEGSPTGGLPA